MLTNHCYVNIPTGWEDENPNGTTIKDCCGKSDQDDPTGSDCCYDSWKVQLNDVSQRYKSATEDYDQVKKKLTFVTDRRDRYKVWVAELDKAEEHARNICNQLEVIASQSRRIWYSSCRAVQAIEILYCMITDFYFQLDGLRKQYDSLMTCVNNNHDQAIQKGTGILKYADEYLQKLEAVIKTSDDIVLPAMQAIRLANLIRNSISTKNCLPPKVKDAKQGTTASAANTNSTGTASSNYDPCNPPDELCPECCDNKSRYYGFKAVICEWYQEFNCKTDCEEVNPRPEPNQQQTSVKTPETPKGDCVQSEEPQAIKDVCPLEPSFKFRICNDPYNKLVNSWLKDDEKEIRKLADCLKEKQKDKESLQACKDSLTKAVNEVNPKERCK